MTAINYYEILNIPQDASRLVIREAYLRLKNAYALDGSALYSLGSEDDAKHQVTLIEEAFQILNDDEERAQFDASLNLTKEGKPSSAAPPPVSMAKFTDEDGIESSPVFIAEHINTVRSTLKVMRTRAQTAHLEATQAKYQEILASQPLGDGETLKALRDAAGVEEDEILERTKISIEYLRALEANQFHRLPQPVYVRGFVRSYLRYLDVPHYEKLVGDYAKRFELWLANAK